MKDLVILKVFLAVTVKIFKLPFYKNTLKYIILIYYLEFLGLPVKVHPQRCFITAQPFRSNHNGSRHVSGNSIKTL